MELPEFIDGKRYAVTAHGYYNSFTDSIRSDKNVVIVNRLRHAKTDGLAFKDLNIASIERLPDPLPTENGSIIEDAEGDILKLDDGWWYHGATAYSIDEIVQPVTIVRIGYRK
jgi:hypothetical protein